MKIFQYCTLHFPAKKSLFLYSSAFSGSTPRRGMKKGRGNEKGWKKTL
jgi:hypothetical protein